MSTTLDTVVAQLATLVQEDGSNYGGADWQSGLWTIPEIVKYVNAACKQFVLQSQISKLIAVVPSVAGQRIYADPPNTMAIDRIAFNNRATYRTTRLNLDRENPKWRTLSGIPRQYHEDQLATKTFEVDRAPISAASGSGYAAIGGLGTLTFMIHAATTVSDAAIVATQNDLTSATANWSAGNVGQPVVIAGAGPGGLPLITTIASFVSASHVTTADAASTTVSAADAGWGLPGFYSADMPGAGEGGILGYTAYGNPAINAVLGDPPNAGLLRQILSGLTNFEVLATRLPADVSSPTDLMQVPDFTLPYIKFWALMQMLNKEGEGQDLPRAKYCKLRFDFGVQLFRRLVSAAHDQVSQPQGAPQ